MSMNKKQKIISICAVVLLGASALGGIKYLEDQKYKEEHTYIAPEDLDGTWYIYSAPELTSVAWLNDDSWLMVTQKDQTLPEDKYKDNKSYAYSETEPIIGQHTIVTYSLESYSNQETYTKNYSKNNLVKIYSVEKNELIKKKEFDLNKIVQKVENGSTISGLIGLTQNEEYISFSLAEKDGTEYLRLSDEKVLKESEMPKEVLQEEKIYEQQKKIRNTGYEIFYATELYTEKYGVKVKYTMPNQYIGISSNTKKEPFFVEKYPELKRIYKNKEKAVIRYIKNPPTPQELVELSFPKDVNPWENVTLRAVDSKSGRDEKITSLEDFMAKYQPRE